MGPPAEDNSSSRCAIIVRDVRRTWTWGLRAGGEWRQLWKATWKFQQSAIRVTKNELRKLGWAIGFAKTGKK
ncbi:hypothetical protein SLEP1_g25661 [Rubroshorea leprosula]|uniref:Uncharacterized protein n=1 Tax=Rubroshorea leprosula TaxID=152421 RepID=A0AAV5JTG3_9ROSI|nr:hypothetical protein SLEP1_g25661 [Rubroshorea leprosula]